jgi:hypothetical protein
MACRHSTSKRSSRTSWRTSGGTTTSVNLLQAAAETILFYHPATWWISAQIRCERENCADDVARQICGDGRAYAAALASVESLRPSSSQPTLAPAVTHGNLLDRVRRVLKLPPLPRRVSPSARSPPRCWR